MDINLLRKIVVISIVAVIANAILGPVGLAIVALVVIWKATKKGES